MKAFFGGLFGDKLNTILKELAGEENKDLKTDKLGLILLPPSVWVNQIYNP